MSHQAEPSIATRPPSPTASESSGSWKEFTEFLPALEAAGFTGEEIHQLIAVNPAEAFTIRVRAREP